MRKSLWHDHEYPLSPQDRFVVLHHGQPVFTCQTALLVIAYLWGRPLDHDPREIIVLDYERPVSMPCLNVRHLGRLLGLENGYSSCPACDPSTKKP